MSYDGAMRVRASCRWCRRDKVKCVRDKPGGPCQMCTKRGRSCESAGVSRQGKRPPGSPDTKAVVPRHCRVGPVPLDPDTDGAAREHLDVLRACGSRSAVLHWLWSSLAKAQRSIDFFSATSTTLSRASGLGLSVDDVAAAFATLTVRQPGPTMPPLPPFAEEFHASPDVAVTLSEWSGRWRWELNEPAQAFFHGAGAAHALPTIMAVHNGSSPNVGMWLFIGSQAAGRQMLYALVRAFGRLPAPGARDPEAVHFAEEDVDAPVPIRTLDGACVGSYRFTIRAGARDKPPCQWQSFRLRQVEDGTPFVDVGGSSAGSAPDAADKELATDAVESDSMEAVLAELLADDAGCHDLASCEGSQPLQDAAGGAAAVALERSYGWSRT